MSLQPQETERRAATSALCDLLAQIAAALAADASFATPGITILTEDKGDIDTEITRQLGALGLAVTVMFSGVSEAKANLPGPVFGVGRFLVEVAENTLTNRGAGGATSLEVAEQAARLLHQLPLSSGRVLLVDAIEPFPGVPPPANVCYHVLLRTSQVSINR
jgi:hypothetical protein